MDGIVSCCSWRIVCHEVWRNVTNEEGALGGVDGDQAWGFRVLKIVMLRVHRIPIVDPKDLDLWEDCNYIHLHCRDILSHCPDIVFHLRLHLLRHSSLCRDVCICVGDSFIFCFLIGLWFLYGELFWRYYRDIWWRYIMYLWKFEVKEVFILINSFMTLNLFYLSFTLPFESLLNVLTKRVLYFGYSGFIAFL